MTTRPSIIGGGGIMLLLALITALLTAPAAQAQPPGVAIDRLTGADPFATAVAVTADTHPDGATTVVIARADDYADALAGVPLAASLDAPILPAEVDEVPQVVLDEIARLGATSAILLGGEAALTAEVETAVAGVTGATERIGGPNRWATAALVAERLAPEGAETIWLVEGDEADPARGWPDAMSAGPVAAAGGDPIVGIVDDIIPAETQSVMDANPDAVIIIVGGEDAVPASIEEALEDRDLTRLAGPTRFDTSGAVYDYAVSELLADPSVRYLTTGRNYLDALIAGPAVAASNGVLLLTADGEDVPAAASSRLSSTTELLTRLVVVGTDADFPPALVDVVTDAITEPAVDAAFCLTLLHNNDGESQLLPIEPPFGGVAAFAATVERERALAAEVPGCVSAGDVLVSSGDNFLPGPTARINRERRTPNDLPWYDAVALDLIGYDAYTLGNHDFDFGPEGLREFYDSFALPQRLISANVDFSDDPLLGPIASDTVAGPDGDGIFPSAVVEPVPGTRVGIIGLTTTLIPEISSPGPTLPVSGNVPGTNNPDVEALAAIISDEVADVQAEGAGIIILSSHLQDIEVERALLQQVRDIDVIISGGGDEVLTNPGVPLQPGEAAPLGSYPLLEPDADGDLVPIVTTPGNFNYVGRLALRFDDDGELLPDTGVNTFRSRLVRVSDTSAPGGVVPSPQIIAEVTDPLEASIEEFFGEVLADQQVPLDGRRETSRSVETNLGNLLTDSYVWASAESIAADAPGWEDVPADRPIVAISNGGGIRNESILPVGEFTRLTTVQVAAFDNLVRAHQDATGAQLVQVLDFALGPDDWSQVAGFEVTVDRSAPEGERIVDLTLDDGTEIVVDGELLGGDELVVFTTIDFLLRGGSGYPFIEAGLDFDDSVEVIIDGEGDLLYSRVLEEYVVGENGLAGVISAADYPEGGEGRVTHR